MPFPVDASTSTAVRNPSIAYLRIDGPAAWRQTHIALVDLIVQRPVKGLMNAWVRGGFFYATNTVAKWHGGQQLELSPSPSRADMPHLPLVSSIPRAYASSPAAPKYIDSA